MTINIGIPQIIWLVMGSYWTNSRDCRAWQATRAT